MKNRIRELRQDRGIKQAELAKHLGIAQNTLSYWERGTYDVDNTSLQKIADFFNCSVDYVLCRAEREISLPSNILPMPKMRKVPLLGTIACGEPILATENIAAYLDVAEEIHCDFALRCKGDSMMDARILDGDVVYIRLQPDVENGEIAAVLIDGMETEATLKRVYKSEGQVVLAPANASYTPLAFVGEDLAHVHILGKAVAFASLVR